jgi:hypothetical protein
VEVNGELDIQALLASKKHLYQLNRRGGGPQSWFGCFGDEINLWSLLGIVPLIVQPIA